MYLVDNMQSTYTYLKYVVVIVVIAHRWAYRTHGDLPTVPVDCLGPTVDLFAVMICCTYTRAVSHPGTACGSELEKYE